MKMKLSALCLLIVVGFCAFAEAEEQVICSKSGPRCRDCRTLGFCSDQGNGKLEFDGDKEEKCGDGFVCDDLTKKCTHNGTCRFKEFSSLSKKDILVPSPYSCRGYFSCAEQRMYLCNDGDHYDWNTHECRPSADIKQCEGYPILCSEYGEIKEISEFQYKCVFDENEQHMKVLYPRLIEAKVHSNSLQFTCVSEGYFEDPENCTMFYKCIKSGNSFQQEHKICREGSYFDPSKKLCVAGKCQNTVPSTTLSTPTTSITTTATATTTPQTQTTPASFVCKEEGTFPDPEDCMKFYKCVKNGNEFDKSHLSCRRGSHFDPAKKACVPGECQTPTTTTIAPTTTASPSTPTSTPTTTASPPTTTTNTPTSAPFDCQSEGVFPDPDNCKMYYRCTKNGDSFAKTHLSCRDGSHFDGTAMKCVAGDCTATSTTQAPTSASTLTTGSSSETTPTTQSTTPTTTTQTTTTPKPTSPPFSCVEEGFFEDPDNCTMFYKCVKNGNSFQQSHLKCRAGSYFDPSQDKCVVGQCHTTLSPTTDSTPTTSVGTTATASVTPTTATVSVTPTTTQTTSAPFACKEEGTFPDPDDCMKFYKCVKNGNGFDKSHLSCRRGSHFDPAKKACVPGECQTPTTTTIAPTTTASPSTPSSTPTTTASPPTTTTITPTSAPFDCQSEGVFPDPDNCKMYYRCTKNGDSFAKTHLSCRDGSHFDGTAMKCVAGDCTATSTTQAPTSASTLTTGSSSETTPTTQSTTPTTTTQTTTTPKPTTPPFSCVEEGYFEDPQNCTMFYKCIKNGNSFQQSHLKCREGSYFDPSKKTCVVGKC